MKNKYIIIILILIFYSTSIFATYQIADKVIYNGKKYKSHCESVFNELLENEEISIDNIIKEKTKIIWSSACLKKYYLTLRIKNNKVYISSVKNLDKKNINLKKYFPDKFNKDKIFAEWYTGVIVLEKGKTIRNDFWLEYSKEIRLYVKNGIIVGKFNIEYKGDDFNIATKYVYNETFIFLNRYNLEVSKTENHLHHNDSEIEKRCYYNPVTSLKLCFFTYPLKSLNKDSLLEKDFQNYLVIDNPDHKIYNVTKVEGNKVYEKNVIFNKNEFTIFYLEYIVDQIKPELIINLYKSIKLVEKIN